MTSKQFLKLSFSLITSHIFEVLLYISRRSLNFKIVPSEKESIPAQKIRWSATEYIYFIFGCDYFTITTNLSANFNLFAKLCLHNWKWLPLHVFIDFSPHCSNLECGGCVKCFLLFFGSYGFNVRWRWMLQHKTGDSKSHLFTCFCWNAHLLQSDISHSIESLLWLE